MVQRTRMRGLPLTAAECAEIRQVAEQVQTEHGVCNKSEIQRRLTFKVERSSIKEVLESPFAQFWPVYFAGAVLILIGAVGLDE